MAKEFKGEINLDVRDSTRTGRVCGRPGVPARGDRADPDQPHARGHLHKGDAVRHWDSLSDEEKRLFSRMAEVYAGFSEYTDAQAGRIVDYLEESGQLENTIIFYCADNGASGEGSPNGSVNEGKIFGGYPDDPQQNLAMIDQLGTPDTYNHHPTGWATPVGSGIRAGRPSPSMARPAA
jgi:arylsulfatase A-like enzyme